MEIRKAYTFDDVLLAPRYSAIESRKTLDISQTLVGHSDLKIQLSHPIIAANMAIFLRIIACGKWLLEQLMTF